ncbi:TPA: hypothetical protein ACY38L_000192 [Pasteurella multocida]
MRLEFNYIVIDDDLASSRSRRRAERLINEINKKIESKGFKPNYKSYISFEEFKSEEGNLDSRRFDLYLSDNNLGNANGADDNKNANDGIEVYLELHNRFPCDFVLYSGATQDMIIKKLIEHLNNKKDAGLFSRFTFVSRSSDNNEQWMQPILELINLIISRREEMNTLRGLYAQLTSKIHKRIEDTLGISQKFKKTIDSLSQRCSEFNLNSNDIDKLHHIRRVRNGLMHYDERICDKKPHTYYLVYLAEDNSEKRIYLENFEEYRIELKNIYQKIEENLS